MDDAAVVGVLERVGELNAEAEHARQFRRIAAEIGREQPALDEVHRDVHLPIRLSHVVDGADVRMIQRGCGLRLVQQSAARALVAEGRGGKDLERDVAVEPGVARAEHDAHRARADLFQHAIRSEWLVDHSVCSGMRP